MIDRDDTDRPIFLIDQKVVIADSVDLLPTEVDFDMDEVFLNFMLLICSETKHNSWIIFVKKKQTGVFNILKELQLKALQ